MAKSFTKNDPAINMTMVGFGQAGTRMADEFAKFRKEDGQPVYNCLALNSNDGDLDGLVHIPPANRVSLQLGGLGKNPEVAMSVLEKNEQAKEKLKQFIHQRVRPQDDLVLFFAGLGGGTGTSTIVKAIEEFFEYSNKPLIQEEFKKLVEEIGVAEIKKDQRKYQKLAFRRAEKKFVKIGVVVTLPLRADGPDALRQVNTFADKIWSLAKNPAKGIAFVIFADNQHFYDEFKNLPDNQKVEIDNYRDYGNVKIAEAIHELNTATTGGGTSVTFDSADFRRIVLEHNGSLVINKITKSSKNIKNGDDIKDMFVSSMKGSILHQPIQLQNEDGSTQKVHHLGLLAVLDQSNKVGSSFIDDARVEIASTLPLTGTVFTGYLEEKNDFSVSAYTFYKAEALPDRLAVGLEKEYKDFMERQSSVKYVAAGISTIDTDEDDGFDDDFDFSELGIGLDDEELQDFPDDQNDDTLEDLDISNIDFSILDED
ncbi:cell division protein FtsZ [Cytobacillus pseudoceanisediminis]|uniref:cell division protein FtsZ n=1 Tax=Cytobacillus pseudoceanisediminis TaxID=3051614 RepID=UPI003C2D0859